MRGEEDGVEDSFPVHMFDTHTTLNNVYGSEYAILRKGTLDWEKVAPHAKAQYALQCAGRTSARYVSLPSRLMNKVM
eukprot:1173582-Prorocentrum_minimum.AAC.3